MLSDREKAKMLNALVMQDRFEDEDLDNYLYASLSQPPIKIINRCESDDELDYIVECPTCKKHIKYGTEIFMLSGHHYCINPGCREKLEYELGINNET